LQDSNYGRGKQWRQTDEITEQTSLRTVTYYHKIVGVDRRIIVEATSDRFDIVEASNALTLHRAQDDDIILVCEF
jgi:hypothetical protein